MTIADRANFGPTSHQQEAVQKFDRAWQQAQEQAKGAAWGAFGAAHYPFQDPKGFAKAIGDFAEEAIQSAADEIRDTYGAAKQWWNEITSMTHTPCEDKWTVIIETALPAAGDAMYLLLTPSPEEILENYLQPYPSKTSRRGAKGDRANKRKPSRSGKVRRSWPSVPDVDSWAAAIIPGAEMVKGRKAGAPTRWAFDAIDRLDRVLWWFLIIDVTKTFFNVWSSGMREARFCSEPHTHLAFSSGNYGPGSFRSIAHISFPWQDGVMKNMGRRRANFFRTDNTGMNGVAVATATYNFQSPPRDTNGFIKLVCGIEGGPASGTVISSPTMQTFNETSVTMSISTPLTDATGLQFDVQGRDGFGFPDVSITANIDIIA